MPFSRLTRPTKSTTWSVGSQAVPAGGTRRPPPAWSAGRPTPVGTRWIRSSGTGRLIRSSTARVGHHHGVGSRRAAARWRVEGGPPAPGAGRVGRPAGGRRSAPQRRPGHAQPAGVQPDARPAAPAPGSGTPRRTRAGRCGRSAPAARRAGGRPARRAGRPVRACGRGPRRAPRRRSRPACPTGGAAQQPGRQAQLGDAAAAPPAAAAGPAVGLVGVARHDRERPVARRGQRVDQGPDRGDHPVATRQVGVGEVGDPHTRHGRRRPINGRLPTRRSVKSGEARLGFASPRRDFGKIGQTGRA